MQIITEPFVRYKYFNFFVQNVNFRLKHPQVGNETLYFFKSFKFKRLMSLPHEKGVLLMKQIRMTDKASDRQKDLISVICSNIFTELVISIYAT